jgi:hypothetical protein
MRTVAAALLLLLSASVMAQDVMGVDAFDGVVDFSMTTKRLHGLIETEPWEEIDNNRFFILQGSVASTTVLDPNPDSYFALVELVDSEWIGLEQIGIYRVQVLLTGPEFAALVPARMPRDPGPEIIQTNDELLVVGRFGILEFTDGSQLPVVQAYHIRK